MATRDVGTGLWLWRASECCTAERGTLHSCAIVTKKNNTNIHKYNNTNIGGWLMVVVG